MKGIGWPQSRNSAAVSQTLFWRIEEQKHDTDYFLPRQIGSENSL
jgi:hypothetical protein